MDVTHRDVLATSRSAQGEPSAAVGARDHVRGIMMMMVMKKVVMMKMIGAVTETGRSPMTWYR